MRNALNTVEETTMCTVEMDGRVTKSNDFVAVLSKDNGDASIIYNTDALTLGMALRLVALAFTECLHKCSEEERAEIKAILEESYPVEACKEVEANA